MTATMNIGTRESVRYDRSKSILCLWIAYNHSWRDNFGNMRSNQMYYLKYQNEKSYNGVESELQRAFDIIKKNYMDGRSFKTLILYQNWNIGGTHPDKNIQNPVVFKIVNKNNLLAFEIAPIPGDDNGEVRAYIEREFSNIIDIHNSVG